jgi:hypothetical protein
MKMACVGAKSSNQGAWAHPGITRSLALFVVKPFGTRMWLTFTFTRMSDGSDLKNEHPVYRV